jgi:glycerate kinase
VTPHPWTVWRGCLTLAYRVAAPEGASPAQVDQLERALSHFADVVAVTFGADIRDHPGAGAAGAAGGVGFGAMALLGASLRPGIDLVLDLLGFHQRLIGADLVVTGEGALDEQTLRGKAPMGVARAARAAGIPVVAVCGRNLLSRNRLREAGIEAAHNLDRTRTLTSAAVSQTPSLSWSSSERRSRAIS